MASFLGKKISLISKAGIRYEGILYTIDQTAFTVALSKVRSFGTEDRGTDRHIPARDEVYEYIIFRGSDISDLHVCENSLYGDDSAIVKIMSPQVTAPASPPVSSPAAPPQDRIAPPQPPVTVSKRFMDFPKTNTANQPPQEEEQPPRWTSERYENEEEDRLEERAARDYRYFQSARRPQREPREQRHRGGPPVGRGNFGRPQKASVGPPTPAADFDFEGSNMLMAEALAGMAVAEEAQEGSKEGQGPQQEAPPVCYDRTKSFFDNISSEVSDRGAGTSERRHRSNAETFGPAEGARGGGGYRGGRWRGGRGGQAGFLRRGGRGRPLAVGGGGYHHRGRPGLEEDL